MQPLQWICNHRVKKRIELRNYAHRNNHSLQNTEEEPVTPGTTAAATAAHTRYLSSPAAATLHGKIHGFVLRLPPQNKAHATFMQTIHFAASRSKPASLYAHGITTWQQSCSHSNAICNHRFKKRIELRTQEQPLVAEHRGGTHYARNDCSRNHHLTRKNTRFRAPASSPKQSPWEHSCSHYNTFRSST